MKTFTQLVAESAKNIDEIFPWDLEDKTDKPPILLDIREPYEYDAMHVKDSLNVPRGILENACEYDFEETVPELVEAREKEIVVICRSGNRSIFAAEVMKNMGFKNVVSLKTGLRGWVDYELPLVDENEQLIDEDDADEYFTPKLRPEQMSPE
ncbi:Rhodanese-related sulfurtransferase [hydrothermal vent metagenome]|uniref:Rhodanese-related sulfurtransferase n=1 Tax=hydrothermal vent metagenome TaxID=652676 RepID=A0A3B1B3A5_9ZZZZ